MTKQMYVSVINNMPPTYEVKEARAFLNGVYLLAIEDFDVLSDDMLEITLIGEQVMKRIRGG